MHQRKGTSAKKVKAKPAKEDTFLDEPEAPAAAEPEEAAPEPTS